MAEPHIGAICEIEGEGLRAEAAGPVRAFWLAAKELGSSWRKFAGPC